MKLFKNNTVILSGIISVLLFTSFTIDNEKIRISEKPDIADDTVKNELRIISRLLKYPQNKRNDSIIEYKRTRVGDSTVRHYYKKMGFFMHFCNKTKSFKNNSTYKHIETIPCENLIDHVIFYRHTKSKITLRHFEEINAFLNYHITVDNIKFLTASFASRDWRRHYFVMRTVNLAHNIEVVLIIKNGHYYACTGDNIP